MSGIAIIVGVDAYPDQPLTSAVHDALAFRDVLLTLNLVQPDEIKLLTSPEQDGGRPATRDEITAALLEPYLNGDDLDRMYVYFSGHGMLAATDASHTTAATVFLPSDVSNPIHQPYKLLNIDDLQASFRTAGPREQFFFVDACRNLVYDQYPPQPPPIGLNGRNQPPVGSRAQGLLFAVSPGAEALGSRDGLGVMTAQLLKALHGEGEALDYDDELDSYVVTFQSVCAYVRARIEEQVAKLPGWQRQYMLPEPRSSGQPLAPVRQVPDPGPASLTLTVEPPDDAKYVNVRLLQRGAPLATPLWPPAQFGQPVEVPRQRFRLSAGSHVGATGAEPELIDARVVSSALIRHKYIGILGQGPTLPPQQKTLDDPGPGVASVAYSPPLGFAARDVKVRGIRSLGPGTGPGQLRLVAAEPWAVADVTGLEPPYATDSTPPLGALGSQPLGALGSEPVELALPGGSYRVRFRVGSEQFSETIAEVNNGQTTQVRATAAVSPLVASVLGIAGAEGVGAEGGGYPESVSFSEASGSVQANPALFFATMLAQGVGADPTELALVVAVDGSRWPSAPGAIATGIRAELRPGYRPLGDRHRLDDRERAFTTLGAPEIIGVRMRLPARDETTLVLQSAELGAVELAVAAVPGLVSSVAVVFRPDGGIDVAQLFAPRSAPRSAPASPPMSAPADLDWATVAGLARRSLLGQWLYQSRELTSRGIEGAPEELRGIVAGEEADPVLSAMAFYSWQRESGRPERDDLARRVGTRLTEEFPFAPDSVVIAALLSGDTGSLSRRFAGTTPVLAESARAVVRLLGDSDQDLATVIRRVAPGSVWMLRWTQPARGGVDQ